MEELAGGIIHLKNLRKTAQNMEDMPEFITSIRNNAIILNAWINYVIIINNGSRYVTKADNKKLRLNLNFKRSFGHSSLAAYVSV